MSIVTLPRTRLPDQITVNFGPTEAIAEAVLALDFAVRKTGIRLSLSTDFEELAHVNRLNQADWYPLTPNFDPRQCSLHQDNAFWLKGVNASGDVVLTEAVRLYTMRNDASYKDEIESLRFYYDEPEAAIASGVSGVVTSPAAASMGGRATYGGAVWVRSDFRGCGLAGLVAPLSHIIALTKWYPDYHTCFLAKALAVKGMGKTYGFHDMDYAVRISNLPGFGPPKFPPTIEFAFCWMTTAEMEAEVQEIAATRHKYVGEPLRNAERPALVET